MDDVVAFLAREAGKKFAESQKRVALEAAQRKMLVDAAKRQAAATWGTPAGRPGGGPASAGKTAAPLAVAAVVLPPPQPPPPPVVAPLPADDFTLPGLGVAEHPSRALLAAFSGGSALLAGIVLAEALAPPLALRGTQLFDRLER